MGDLDKLNLFNKSRYSLSEEDRAVNGLLALFDHGPPSLVESFLTFVGAPVEPQSVVKIRDHVPYSPESIVDGELSVSDSLLVAIEAKVYVGQFDDPEQAERYLKLLKERNEPNRVLLLISPDVAEPRIASSIPNQSRECRLNWVSWAEICRFLEREMLITCVDSDVSQFLISQYLDYLDTMGLLVRLGDSENNDETLAPQLHFLFGNIAAEKILLHIYHHGGGTVSGISRDHSLGRGATQRVLARLVRGGVLARESRGNTIWYSFNSRGPFVGPLIDIIRIVYDRMTDEERREVFEPENSISR